MMKKFLDSSSLREKITVREKERGKKCLHNQGEIFMANLRENIALVKRAFFFFGGFIYGFVFLFYFYFYLLSILVPENKTRRKLSLDLLNK